MVKKLLFFGVFVMSLAGGLQAQIVDKIGFIERGKASYFADDRGGIFTASGERYNMNDLIASHPFIAFNSFVKVTNLDNGQAVIVRVNDRATSRGHIIELSKAAAERVGATGQLSIDVKIEIVPNPAQPRPTTFESPATVNSGGTANNGYNVVPESTPNGGNQGQAVAQPNNVQPTPYAPEAESPKPMAPSKPPAEMMEEVGTYKTDGTPVKALGYGVQVGWFTKPKEAISLAKRFQNLQFGNIYIQSGWESGKKAYRVVIGSFLNKADTQGLVDFLNERHYNAFPRKHYGVD